jgi:hypothetical protein
MCESSSEILEVLVVGRGRGRGRGCGSGDGSKGAGGRNARPSSEHSVVNEERRLVLELC